MPHYKQLTDQDYMPFGKFSRGCDRRRMKDVPASYLFWLWTNGMQHAENNSVADYIRNNMNVLKDEYPDGIWDED